MGANEDKTKFSIRVDTRLLELADSCIRDGTARNRTELIGDALRFYLGADVTDIILQLCRRRIPQVAGGKNYFWHDATTPLHSDPAVIFPPSVFPPLVPVRILELYCAVDALHFLHTLCMEAIQ